MWAEDLFHHVTSKNVQIHFGKSRTVIVGTWSTLTTHSWHIKAHASTPVY